MKGRILAATALLFGLGFAAPIAPRAGAQTSVTVPIEMQNNSGISGIWRH